MHFNIIVHKSHNAFKKTNNFKKHTESEHEENVTLFGDFNSSPALHSWAEVTKVHRPGHQDPDLEDSIQEVENTSKEIYPNPIENETQEERDEWQTVGKGGRIRDKYTIPVLNRFESLPEDNEVLAENNPDFSCENCDLRFSTKSLLKTHIKVHKNTSQCNCVLSKEHIKAVDEVKLLRK